MGRPVLPIARDSRRLLARRRGLYAVVDALQVRRQRPLHGKRLSRGARSEVSGERGAPSAIVSGKTFRYEGHRRVGAPSADIEITAESCVERATSFVETGEHHCDVVLPILHLD